MGRIIPKDTNQILSVGPTHFNFARGKYIEKIPTSLSFYYGSSGDMVVIFKIDGTSLTAKVVGMCKKSRLNHFIFTNDGLVSAGDFERPVNQLSAFTQDGKNWIEGHVNGTRPARYPHSSWL